MKYNGINIDFPEIDGISDRQIWYAEHLREKYIQDHFDRFVEIAECVEYSVNKRDIDYIDNDEIPDFGLDFDEYEKTVLYGVTAGGIIATLKEFYER